MKMEVAKTKMRTIQNPSSKRHFLLENIQLPRMYVALTLWGLWINPMMRRRSHPGAQ
jgi:hypothetical protein